MPQVTVSRKYERYAIKRKTKKTKFSNLFYKIYYTSRNILCDTVFQKCTSRTYVSQYGSQNKFMKIRLAGKVF